MRKTYRYDKNLGKMVEVKPIGSERKGPHIIGDIEPYQVIGPEYGRWITSRSHHREYLKRHDLQEAGTDRKAFGLGDDE